MRDKVVKLTSSGEKSSIAGGPDILISLLSVFRAFVVAAN